VVGLGRLVRVLVVDVRSGGELFVEDSWVGGGPVGGHLDGPPAVGQGAGKEPAGRGEFPFLGG